MTAAPSGVEESPDTAGQDARASEAAKADGKWHRKETATGIVLSAKTSLAMWLRSRDGFAGTTIKLAGGKGEKVG